MYTKPGTSFVYLYIHAETDRLWRYKTTVSSPIQNAIADVQASPLPPHSAQEKKIAITLPPDGVSDFKIIRVILEATLKRVLVCRNGLPS